MPRLDVSLTLVADGCVPPSPGCALYEVLDRLGPSVFAGLLDPDGVVHYANQAALRAIGSAPEQVLGQRFEATPWWQGCDLSRRRLSQALALAARGEASRFDVRIATRSGDTRVMDFSLLPFYGPDGRVAWLIASACDVTEREQARHQLRLTRHAVEQANDAWLQVGQDGVIRDADAAACRLLGQTLELLLRLRMPDVDTQVDDRQRTQSWSELCERGSLRFETSVRRHDGQGIPADVFVRLATNGDEIRAQGCIDERRERRAVGGRIQSEAPQSQVAEHHRAQETVKAHCDDLEHLLRERTAELRAAKEKAEAASDAKSSFLASMSHELRTPLNAVLGFSHILQRSGGLSESHQRAIHLIRQSGEHMLTLVDDLLGLAKIEAGRLDILPAEFDPDSFFQVMLGMVRVRADQNADLELVCDLPAKWPPSIHADETRLRQVLINLLDNAIKFTSRGQVTLRARFRSPSKLRMEIEDTGVAMHEEQLARLFHPFEQVGDARQRALGTGLGLAISQRLVRLMGSEIVAESRPGKGNLFWFELDVGTPARASPAFVVD